MQLIQFFSSQKERKIYKINCGNCGPHFICTRQTQERIYQTLKMVECRAAQINIGT